MRSCFLGIVLIFLPRISIFTSASELKISSDNVIVKPGDTYNFTCSIQPVVKLGYCRCQIQGLENGIVYRGSKIADGICEFSINNITESNNGQVECLAANLSDEVTKGISKLTVAKKPERPVLNPTVIKSFKAGDNLKVDCKVMNGRPAANISWELDGKIVTAKDNPIIIDGKNDTQTISQTFQMVLTLPKKVQLKCIADHLAYDNAESATIEINVESKPISRNETSSIKLVEGKNTAIVVIFQGNPKPVIELSAVFANESKLKMNNDSRHVLTEVQERENYIVTLNLLNVQSADQIREYRFTAKNYIGTTEVIVKTSFDDASNIGLIIGILLAILIGLASGFVAYAAKTKKFCFKSKWTGVPAHNTAS